MKSFVPQFGALILFACLLAVPSFAAPPTLETTGDAVPSEVRQNQTVEFHILYKQAEGDKPQNAILVLESPTGSTKVPGKVSSGDPTTGVEIDFPVTIENTGQYRYHFEVTSSTGATARYPTTPGDSLEFTSASVVQKYVMLGVGILIALLFLPFIVYVATRSLNKRGNPSSAARIALLIGVLASYALFLFLFYSVYSILGGVIGAIVALALLIVLFSRR